MKKDQYIPHEVSMRTTSEVMKLIEKEGMTGYGIYWALMEYLRVQDDYTGDVRILKTLARQLKTKLSKVESVLHNYGLFTIKDFTFRSTKLDTMMKPLEDKRKAMSKRNVSKLEAERKQSESKVETECKQAACNSLETSSDISLSKVKESKEENTPSKSSSSTAGSGTTVFRISIPRLSQTLISCFPWTENSIVPFVPTTRIRSPFSAAVQQNRS